jgi:hypothetical protein
MFNETDGAATGGYAFDSRAACARRGADGASAVNVRGELDVLRAAHHRNRQLACAVGIGKRALRKAKLRLAPILAELGYHFHGDALRKFRDRKNHMRGGA